MWIYLNDAFLSVVAATEPDAGGELAVRARCRGDLERVFGDDVKVFHTRASDYAFRCFVTRQRLAEVMASRIESIGYTNFKNSVAEDDRHDAYLDCWSAMHALQRERLAPKRRPKARARRFVDLGDDPSDAFDWMPPDQYHETQYDDEEFI